MTREGEIGGKGRGREGGKRRGREGKRTFERSSISKFANTPLVSEQC